MLLKIKNNKKDFEAGVLNYVPLPAEFKQFAAWYPGTRRGEYVGITGGTSSAKSQITRCIYLFNSIHWAIKNKVNLKVLWFGLEESKDEAKYYLLSWLLYKTYGIRYNIEHFEAVGKTVKDEHLDHIGQIEKTFNLFWSYIEFHDAEYTTHGIYNTVLEFAGTRGTFYYRGEVVKVGEKYDEYRPNDPKEFVIAVFDHLGILEKTDEGSDRLAMGQMSRYIRQYICKLLNYIGVAVVQQMSEMENLEHIKSDQVYASLQGFGDNKTITRDMMTIIGITSPARYGINTLNTNQTHLGNKGSFNVGKLEVGDAYRVLGILKRRFGLVNKRTLLLFDGCVGFFKGVESTDEISEWGEIMRTYEEAEYSKYIVSQDNIGY